MQSTRPKIPIIIIINRSFSAPHITAYLPVPLGLCSASSRIGIPYRYISPPPSPDRAVVSGGSVYMCTPCLWRLRWSAAGRGRDAAAGPTLSGTPDDGATADVFMFCLFCHGSSALASPMCSATSMSRYRRCVLGGGGKPSTANSD